MMNVKQFEKNLLLYGADLLKWPDGIRQAGHKALQEYPGLRASLAEHEHLERILKTRKYEEPSGDLAYRIIEDSLRLQKKAQPRLGGFLAQLVGEFSLAKPAFTVVSVLMISVLIIGFAIGSSYPTERASGEEEQQTNLQEFLHYEGEVL